MDDVNNDREAHRKRPFEEEEQPLKKRWDNTSRKKQARRKRDKTAP